MRTSFSLWQGELTDISVAGARFKVNGPPKEGVEALIEWDSFETFCRVIWSTAGQCGVRFDKELPQSVVDQVKIRSATLEPSARVGNIPLGRKRSGAKGTVIPIR